MNDNIGCPSINAFFRRWALIGVSNPEMRIFIQDTEIKRLRGGVVYHAAQASAPIDADIGQKTIYRWKRLKVDRRANHE